MDKYITAKELSELTGIAANSIYRLVRQGAIPYYQIGRHYRFKMSDFEKGGRYEKVEILD